MKGVVKKITGKLVNDPALEAEGKAEMLGNESGKPQQKRRAKSLNPDPHRRG